MMMAFTVVILHCLGDCGKQVPDAGTLLCNSLTLNRFPAKLGTGSSDDLKSISISFASPGFESIGTADIGTGLETLESMYLQRDSIKAIADGSFASLKALHTLDLDGNQIEVITNKTFVGLTNLVKLALNSNKLSEIRNGAFDTMPLLDELELRNNALPAIPCGAFRGVAQDGGSISYVDLEANFIAEVPEQPCLPSTLLELDLSDNELDYVHPDAFTGMTALRVLDLSDDHTKYPHRGSLANLTHLEEGTFRGLVGMVNLYLNGNPLARLDVALFAELPTMRRLFLKGTVLQCGGSVNQHQGQPFLWTTTVKVTFENAECECAAQEDGITYDLVYADSNSSVSCIKATTTATTSTATSTTPTVTTTTTTTATTFTATSTTPTVTTTTTTTATTVTPTYTTTTTTVTTATITRTTATTTTAVTTATSTTSTATTLNPNGCMNDASLVIYAGRSLETAHALDFGPTQWLPFTDRTVWHSVPSNGCEPLAQNPGNNHKWDHSVLVVERGDCNFWQKVLNGQNAGAQLVIIMNYEKSQPLLGSATESGAVWAGMECQNDEDGGCDAITIPSVFLEFVDLPNGATLDLSCLAQTTATTTTATTTTATTVTVTTTTSATTTSGTASSTTVTTTVSTTTMQPASTASTAPTALPLATSATTVGTGESSSYSCAFPKNTSGCSCWFDDDAYAIDEPQGFPAADCACCDVYGDLCTQAGWRNGDGTVEGTASCTEESTTTTQPASTALSTYDDASHDKEGSAAAAGGAVAGILALVVIGAVAYKCMGKQKALHGVGGLAYVEGGTDLKHGFADQRTLAAETFVNPNFTLGQEGDAGTNGGPPAPAPRLRSRSLEEEILQYTTSAAVRDGSGPSLYPEPVDGFSPPDDIRKDLLAATQNSDTLVKIGSSVELGDGHTTNNLRAPSAANNNYGRMAVSTAAGYATFRDSPNKHPTPAQRRSMKLRATNTLGMLSEANAIQKDSFWKRVEEIPAALATKHSRSSLPSFALHDGDDCLAVNTAIADNNADPFILNVADLLVEETGVLGKGNYGLVRRGTLAGHDDVVAVKTLPITREHSREEQHDLMMEIETLRILTVDGGHGNVIALIGYIPCTSPIMVTEYAQYGSLDKYLKKKRNADPPEALSDATTVLFAYQIALGMAYIALKKMVHRDLASRNILVADNATGRGEQCKITDFGLARDTYATTDGMYTSRVDANPTAWKWTAIEGLTDAQFTTEGDAWSYGITLTELCSLAMTPYMQYRQFSVDFFNALNDGMRMTMRDEWPLALRQIMPACWQKEPLRRPTFPHIVQTLRAALNVMTGDAGLGRRLSQKERDAIDYEAAQPAAGPAFYEYMGSSHSARPPSPSSGRMIMQRSVSEESTASSSLVPTGILGSGQQQPSASRNTFFLADDGGGSGPGVSSDGSMPSSTTSSAARGVPMVAEATRHLDDPEQFANLGTPFRRSISQEFLTSPLPTSPTTPVADYGSDSESTASSARPESVMSDGFTRTKSVYSLASRGGPVAIHADATVDFETAVNAAAAHAQRRPVSAPRSATSYDLAGQQPADYDLARKQQQQQQQQQHGDVPYASASPDNHRPAYQLAQQDNHAPPYDLAAGHRSSGAAGMLLLPPPPMFEDNHEEASVMRVVSDSAC